MRSSAQPQGRSPVVTLAVVVAVIIGVVAWAYMPASMKSGTFLKVASQVLADHGSESDEEVGSRLRDLAIRSSLSMGDDGVTITRPSGNTIEARLRYWHPVNLVVYRTRSEFDEVIKATVRVREQVREATVKPPVAAQKKAEPAEITNEAEHD